jgi:hypothetical protein
MIVSFQFGPWCAYRYYPEDTTGGISFRVTISLNDLFSINIFLLLSMKLLFCLLMFIWS